MDTEEPQPKRIRRRTSILPGNSASLGSSALNGGTEQKEENEKLAMYFKAVEDEKKHWVDYENQLKEEYINLKRSLTKPNEAAVGDMKFMDYLEEDEKNLFLELEDIKMAKEQFISSVRSLENGYMLLVPEVKNARKHLQQLLDKKKETCMKAQMEIFEASNFN